MTNIKASVVFSFLFFILISIVANAQDKVLLMNGHEFDCRVVNDSGTVLILEVTKRSGKVKQKEFHKNDVFSYTLLNQNEKILYAKDTMLGDIYTVSEMRVYMAGERDGGRNFTAHPTMVVGFLLCGAASYSGGDGVLLTILPTIAYTCLQLIPKIKIREATMSDPDYKYNDIYADGYEPPARSRKLMAAMAGGAAGAAAGVLLYIVLN